MRATYFECTSYALGAMALTLLCTTYHYQGAAHKWEAEAHELQGKVDKLEARIKVLMPKREGTLSIQNRNPLNVKALGGKDKWQGQIGVDKFGHARFATWEHGMRAAAFVLKNYAQKHKVETVRGIVERFAEGNREEYIAFLCKRLGVKDTEKISIIKRMPEILRAMARFESGEKLPEHLFVAYDIVGAI